MANGIGRVVGLHAEDGFVDHREAHLRAHRRTRLVGDQHRESARLARFRDSLVSRDRDLQGPRRGGHAEAPLGAIQPAVAQVGDADKHVADVTFVDRYFNRFRRRRPQYTEPGDVLTFLGHQHRTGDGLTTNNQAGRLARLIGLSIRK